MLGDILRSAAPDHVIMLQTPNPRHNLEPEPFWVLPGPPSCSGGAAQLPSIAQLPALEQPPGEGADCPPEVRCAGVLCLMLAL